MQWLATHPDIPFGVHLTTVGDSLHYRWKPISCQEHVSSLVDETGNFYNWHRIAEFFARARLDELEVEFSAQIDTVLAAGPRRVAAVASSLANRQRRCSLRRRSDCQAGAQRRNQGISAEVCCIRRASGRPPLQATLIEHGDTHDDKHGGDRQRAREWHHQSAGRAATPKSQRPHQNEISPK